MKKIILFFTICFSLALAGNVSAHTPRIIYDKPGDIQVQNPGNSQAFYDELQGEPRSYFIRSDFDFNLYINLLVPEITNYKGRYSAQIYLVKDEKETEIALIDADSVEWKEYYEEFGRDYYLKGPEFEKALKAGTYKIKVFSSDPPAGEAGNTGKYVFVVGEKEYFSLQDVVNVYWQLPLLKLKFFGSPIEQFFFTPFFIAALILLAVIIFLLWIIVSLISYTNKKMMGELTKTLILTSAGMQVKDEILKVLAKPPHQTSVAHIITAIKPEQDTSYAEKDKEIMQKAGFNVQDIDIEGKNQVQLMKLLERKDIIYVQGGNTFYLLKHIRKSGFDKVVKKLIRKGVMYVGVSAGTMVAGKSIETADWKTPKDHFKLMGLSGMGLVPYNFFVHYKPEHEELIKQKMPNQKKRRWLKILKDDQAFIAQGATMILVGKGEEIKI